MNLNVLDNALHELKKKVKEKQEVNFICEKFSQEKVSPKMDTPFKESPKEKQTVVAFLPQPFMDLTTFQDVSFQGQSYKAGDKLTLTLEEARELLEQSRRECERKWRGYRN